MIRSRDVIPSPLQHAMLATRVLVALDRYEEAGRAPALDAAMGGALQYLGKILQGRNNAKDLRIDADSSYESALAYGEAMRAVEISTGGSGSAKFLEFVSELQGIASALRLNEPVNKQSVEELKQFFKQVRSVALSSGERQVEKISLLA
jgi:hypothetical protein